MAPSENQSLPSWVVTHSLLSVSCLFLYFYTSSLDPPPALARHSPTTIHLATLLAGGQLWRHRAGMDATRSPGNNDIPKCDTRDMVWEEHRYGSSFPRAGHVKKILYQTRHKGLEQEGREAEGLSGWPLESTDLSSRSSSATFQLGDKPNPLWPSLPLSGKMVSITHCFAT